MTGFSKNFNKLCKLKKFMSQVFSIGKKLIENVELRVILKYRGKSNAGSGC